MPVILSMAQNCEGVDNFVMLVLAPVMKRSTRQQLSLFCGAEIAQAYEMIFLKIAFNHFQSIFTNVILFESLNFL